mmetsp:Transcript_64516/g.154079  ORF Transcript_64516/g.154079 Transcript_64516/m.154079 type:complete len:419 (-) Transcript_64516:25-1281(-)
MAGAALQEGYDREWKAWRLGHVSTYVEAAIQRQRASGPPREVPPGGNLGLAVCVVGQASRLEVESKLENVFKPLAEDLKVDVFVALETNSSTYSNHVTILNQEECTSEPSEEEVREEWKPFYTAGVYIPHYNWDVLLSRWPRYRPHAKDRLGKLSGHISQFEKTYACSKLIQAYEASVGGKYEVIVKLRDNTIALRDFSIVHLQQWASPRNFADYVYVKACKDWYGTNDKVMVLPRKFLSPALEEPYLAYLDVHVGNATMIQKVIHVGNTEQLLKLVLDIYHVPILGVDAGTLPLVDGRCKGLMPDFGFASRSDRRPRKQFCLIGKVFDCRDPEQWNWNWYLDMTCPGEFEYKLLDQAYAHAQRNFGAYFPFLVIPWLVAFLIAWAWRPMMVRICRSAYPPLFMLIDWCSQHRGRERY